MLQDTPHTHTLIRAIFTPNLDAGPLACTSCPAHFMLDSGLCMECLGSQFYDAPTQQCKTCHESCRSCTGTGQYSCATCAFPLHLDRLNNQCVPCCPTEALPEDQSCCHCDKNSGKLIGDAVYLYTAKGEKRTKRCLGFVF